MQTDVPPERYQIPRVGMLAQVRNRLANISSVEHFDAGAEGRFHLVTVEYSDLNIPRDDQLIWEREINAHILEPNALPEPYSQPPMQLNQFNALVRAIRWLPIHLILNLNLKTVNQFDLPYPPHSLERLKLMIISLCLY